MSVEEKYVEVKHLIALGKEKGFLLYDEIYETLPEEITSLPEELDEIYIRFNDLGIDVWETLDAAATKPFGFMKFTPGPGVGGHCLPIDPSYLAWRVKQHLGHTFRFVELANDVNEHMPDYVHRRVTELLNRQRKTRCQGPRRNRAICVGARLARRRLTLSATRARNSNF